MSKHATENDFDWNKPIPRDVFITHFAGAFADLNLTPGQISALMMTGVLMSIGDLDKMIKSIADALEGSRGDKCPL